jgi:hypothetical protein
VNLLAIVACGFAACLKQRSAQIPDQAHGQESRKDAKVKKTKKRSHKKSWDENIALSGCAIKSQVRDVPYQSPLLSDVRLFLS